MSEELSRLRDLEPELRKLGIASLYLFGSAARHEQTARSDIDLFFDSAPNARLSLLDVIGIRQFLEETLGRRVDLMTRDSLHRLLREDIEAEAVSVF